MMFVKNLIISKNREVNVEIGSGHKTFYGQRSKKEVNTLFKYIVCVCVCMLPSI